MSMESFMQFSPTKTSLVWNFGHHGDNADVRMHAGARIQATDNSLVVEWFFGAVVSHEYLEVGSSIS